MSVATQQNGRLFTLGFSGGVFKFTLTSGAIAGTGAEDVSLHAITQLNAAAAGQPQVYHQITGNVRIVGVSCSLVLGSPFGGQAAATTGGFVTTVFGSVGVNIYQTRSPNAVTTNEPNQILIASVAPTGTFHPVDFLLSPQGETVGNADPASYLQALGIYRNSNTAGTYAAGATPPQVTANHGLINVTLSCVRE